jgi:hypothetical protein
MRLRYVRIRNLPPLEDVAITFGHERALGRACAIHFVVGVNGSGKTRLLQALAEVFLDLERQRIPAFPVTLAYERHEITEHYAVSLHHPGGVASNAKFMVFKLPDENALDALDWATLHERTDLPIYINSSGDILPGSGSIGAFLPRVLVGYTSGATAPWERIFAPPPPALDEALADAPPAVELDSERPAGWSVEREAELKTADPTNPQQFEEMTRYKRSGEISNLPTIGLFVTPEALRWAVCATALGSFAEEFKQRMAGEAEEKQFTSEIGQSLASRQRMPGLRGILNEVDWLWPETLSLRIHWRAERLAGQRPQQIQRLAKIATRVLRDPGQHESLAGRTFHSTCAGKQRTSKDWSKRPRRRCSRRSAEASPRRSPFSAS